MKIHTEWMQLKPDIIYVTGGASKNDAIVQILSDVFQAKVQRSDICGSVALGAAIRAAQHICRIPSKILNLYFVLTIIVTLCLIQILKSL